MTIKRKDKKLFLIYIGNEILSSMTLFGSPIFYFFLILLLSRFNIVLAFRIIFVIILVELICWTIKFFYFKERPVKQLHLNFFESIDANSFPSIHTARISALAVMVNFFYQDLLLLIVSLVLVFSVGYSRIYLKKHYLTDVIGGFITGAACSIVLILF